MSNQQQIEAEISLTVETLIDNVCNSVPDERKFSHTQKQFFPSVAYIHSLQLLKHCNRLPKVKARARFVHELISAYGLLKHESLHVIEAKPATESQLRSFHSEEYISFIKYISDQQGEVGDDDYDNNENEFELDEELMNDEFGIGYDCPPLPKHYDLISHIAGASLTAATAISSRKYSVAINWTGGWHHAHKDEASGYCYVNDIVLAILHLLQNGFNRVLYVDLDLHHGDGVENAFAHSSKVMTVSFHKYEVGFFPGTGNVGDIGFGSKGKYYAVNVPLKDGIRDDNFATIVKQVLTKVKQSFVPDVIVCQCGADGLIGDPMSSFNLTLKGPGECVKYLLNWKVPIILLGGGGYNMTNTARLWTLLTSIALNVELTNDIPDHSYFLQYRPTYELHIEQGNRCDTNDMEHVSKILQTIFRNLDQIRLKPV